MKREINCAECASGWRRIQRSTPGDPDATIYRDEHLRIVRGTAINDCQCEGCFVRIAAGSTCYAVSLYTEDRPHFKWEHDALILPGER